MGFLANKRILITGMISPRSIAYGIAQAMHREGAELAFTYQNERFRDRVAEMAAELGSNLIFPLDVAEDAQIEGLALTVLKDDAGFFPRYDAVLLYRLDLPTKHPRAWAAMQTLQGRIDEPAMIAMNAQAENKQRPFDAIARDFLARSTSAST